MTTNLLAAASKFQICIYLSMFSMVAAAQGTGAIVESRPLVLGQSNSQSAANSAVNNDAMSLLLQQNQQLQTEVQALRGLIEEQSFELRKLQRDSLTRYTNMDERLSALEAGALTAAARPAPATTLSSTGAPTTAATVAPATTAADSFGNTSIPTTTTPLVTNTNPSSGAQQSLRQASQQSTSGPGSTATGQAAATRPGSQQTQQPQSLALTPAPTSGGGSRGTLEPAVLSEQQLYQMAYDSVINSNFDRSIAEFDQYLSIYPQGRFVTNAHYWKGQAYLYLNRYAEARDAYEIIINRYPESPKLPDAMYGLGLAYQGLGNTPQARRLLTEIKSKFPNTGVANLADTRLLSLD